MQKVVIFGVLTALFFLLTPATRAQDADEVARLRRENEMLKKEIELLKKEIELLKKDAKSKPDGAEDPKTGAKSVTKATVDDVDFELVGCTRKGNKVTFTISMLCDKEDKLMGGAGAKGYGLFLTASGGVKVKPSLTEGPGRRIQLKKGIASKFQIIITGVDEDIPSFDEVVLHEGFSGAEKDVHFYNISIKK
jgi:hypothetical protein